MNDVRLIPESLPYLHDYALIPIAFDITERLDLASGDRALITATLPTRAVATPYAKDYDAGPGHHPTQWPCRADFRNWWFAAAFVEGRRVGGAVVIPKTRGAEGERPGLDTAVLWDIRVHPAFRRRGVGRALLAFAESHARAGGDRHVQVETQDINVPAARFYAAAGYVLVAINPHAYVDLPDETQLIWQKDLDVAPPHEVSS